MTAKIADITAIDSIHSYVMDPVSTFALVGSVLTFVDCGFKLSKYAAEIQNSPNGCLASAESVERYASEVIKSISLRIANLTRIQDALGKRESGNIGRKVVW